MEGTMLVIVKGNRGEAELAANFRGLTLTYLSTNEQGNTLGYVDVNEWRTVTQWFADNQKAPYPIGTLLWYRWPEDK